MRILFIISVFWCSFINAQSLLYEENFEGGYGSTPSWFPLSQTVKPWLNTAHSKENNGYPEAVQNVVITGGNTNAARFRIAKDEPLYKGETYRSEITIVKADEDARITPESWYSFRVLFPTDGSASDARKTSINQWYEDGSDELTVRTQYGRCFMELQNGSNVYRWDLFSEVATLNITSVASFAFHPLDEWVQFVFHVNHKFDGSGYIEIYRDGVLIHTYNGPTIHAKLPKWKMGIYSSATSSTVPYKIIYFDDIRVGNKDSNLEEMMDEAPPANLPPLAAAGADQSITLPTSSVTLNGSGSSDPDGTITTYAWTKTSGGSATIVSASSANTDITGLTVGSYVFRLTVTDNGGSTDFDEVTVTVFAEPNTPPVAVAGDDQSITLPTSSVNLDGSGSTDSDGSITNYLWTKIDGGSATISTPNNVTTTVSGLTTGTYTFRLTITDNDGAVSTDNVTINVQAAPAENAPPTANAGDNIEITLPINSTTLSGALSADSDGNIVSYLWQKITGPIGGLVTSPNNVTTTVTGMQSGVYDFRLTVTDDDGATATTVVQITVHKAPEAPSPEVIRTKKKYKVSNRKNGVFY